MGLEQDYPPLSLLSVGAFLELEGNEVFIKNLEIFEQLEYKGYSDRTDSFNYTIDTTNNVTNAAVFYDFTDVELVNGASLNFEIRSISLATRSDLV